MVRIQTTYLGELRCGALHEPSGAELQTDAPKDNCGRGESFSPTDLVATALATCMLTIMGIKAREHDWDLKGVKASVVKHMAADPVRRIGKLVIVFENMPSGLDKKARTILEKAALACPVKASLHPDMELDLDFQWGPGAD